MYTVSASTLRAHRQKCSDNCRPIAARATLRQTLEGYGLCPQDNPTTLDTKARGKNDAIDNSNLSVLEAKRIVDKEGFLQRNDPSVGESVAVLEQNNFPF